MGLVLAIFFGYVVLYVTGADRDYLGFLNVVCFEVFLLCGIAMLSLIVANKVMLDRFLIAVPVIRTASDLDKLKPVVRANMYWSLVTILLLAVGSLSGVMTLFTKELTAGICVAVLTTATALVSHWYQPSEEKVKQIKCLDESIEEELNDILQCWMHQALPKF